MMLPPEASRPDPDLLRRLKEFQIQVRNPSRRIEPVVPARGPLSGRDAEILERLRRQLPSVAKSLEQVLQDLNDHTRMSYMGPAGEIREVLRATIHHLAPDEEVQSQAWYVGVSKGTHNNPSQAERIRYAVQRRGGSTQQAKGVDELIDQLVAQIGRETYAAGSSAFHAGTVRQKVRKLTGWVFAVLDEVLPE